MKLTLEGIKDRAAWQSAGIKLPDYDVQAVSEKAKKHPVWAHFGAGNIFRIFVGGMADAMLEKGAMDRGITCVETFDFDVVDQIYTPYDNLVLAVTLNADATTDKRVLGSLSEAIKAQSNVPENWNRLKAVFADPGLQMISFTITEKGYALKNASGALPFSKRCSSMAQTIAIAPVVFSGPLSISACTNGKKSPDAFLSA